MELISAAGNCEAGLGVTLTRPLIKSFIFFLNFTLQLLYQQPEMQDVGQKILKLLVFNGNMVGNAVLRIMDCTSQNILKRNIYPRLRDWSELHFPWANGHFVFSSSYFFFDRLFESCGCVYLPLLAGRKLVGRAKCVANF